MRRMYSENQIKKIVEELIPKKYKHYCFFEYNSQELCIEIINASNEDLTGKDITDFIQSLDANASYPIKQTKHAAYYTSNFPTVDSITNSQTGGAKFVYNLFTIQRVAADNVNVTVGTSSVYSDVTITKQYYVEL